MVKARKRIGKGKLKKTCDWRGCKKRATVGLVVNAKRKSYCRQHAIWVIE